MTRKEITHQINKAKAKYNELLTQAKNCTDATKREELIEEAQGWGIREVRLTEMKSGTSHSLASGYYKHTDALDDAQTLDDEGRYSW